MAQFVGRISLSVSSL